MIGPAPPKGRHRVSSTRARPNSRLEVKAALLADTGRVRLLYTDDTGRLVAEVRGDSGTTHTARVTAGGHTSCTCLAGWRHQPCSHVLAALIASQPTWDSL